VTGQGVRIFRMWTSESDPLTSSTAIPLGVRYLRCCMWNGGWVCIPMFHVMSSNIQQKKKVLTGNFKVPEERGKTRPVISHPGWYTWTLSVPYQSTKALSQKKLYGKGVPANRLKPVDAPSPSSVWTGRGLGPPRSSCITPAHPSFNTVSQDREKDSRPLKNSRLKALGTAAVAAAAADTWLRGAEVEKRVVELGSGRRILPTDVLGKTLILRWHWEHRHAAEPAMCGVSLTTPVEVVEGWRWGCPATVALLRARVGRAPLAGPTDGRFVFIASSGRHGRRAERRRVAESLSEVVRARKSSNSDGSNPNRGARN